MLVVAILMSQVAEQVLEALSGVGFRKEISDWIHERKDELGIEQALPALLQIFQDDLLQLSVGKEAERIVRELEDVVLNGELGAVLSAKPEANKDFSTEFECI